MSNTARKSPKSSKVAEPSATLAQITNRSCQADPFARPVRHVMFQPPVGHELVSPLMQEQRYKTRFPGHELFGQAVYKLEQQYQSGLAASKQRQSK